MPVSNTNRRVKLSITTQNVTTSRSTQNYRLTVVASNGNLMPNELFRYVRIPAGVGYPESVDKYLGVCTPAELISLPIDDPDPDLDVMWFRTASLDLTLTDTDQASSAVETIVTAITQLKAALDYTDNQTQASDFWIGMPPV